METHNSDMLNFLVEMIRSNPYVAGCLSHCQDAWWPWVRTQLVATLRVNSESQAQGCDGNTFQNSMRLYRFFRSLVDGSLRIPKKWTDKHINQKPEKLTYQLTYHFI